MARIVRCPSCAAMHRALAGQTQILCDYCRSWIHCERAVHAEELCLASAPDRRDAERVVSDWLLRQGIHGAALRRPEQGIYALWQLSSEAGEEASFAATKDAHPLLRRMRPAAAPMVPVERRDSGLELPPLELTRAEAEKAALASFQDRQARLATVRLLWLPYTRLEIRHQAGSFEAVHLPGFERPLVEPIPATARRAPVQAPLLWGYASFVATLFAISIFAPSRAASAVLLAALLAAALPLWTRWALSRGNDG